MRKSYQQSINYFRQVNWMLLLFLLLMLNVKLVVKVAAILFILIANYKSISWKNIRQQRLIFFYVAMIGIAGINFLLQVNQFSLNYSIAAFFGVSLWILAAIAGFFLYIIVQKDSKQRLHRTIELFFILHIAVIGINLLMIILETGALNPYTYKGINQKYYINTGDYITGITFDTPVSTAMISAFGLLYFLYRRCYLLSMAAMASLLLIGSNVTNMLFIAILILTFFLYTNKAQKSIIVVCICLLIFFVTKISPQNNEYVGRFLYKIMGKNYDRPERNKSLEFIVQQPDSLLNDEEKRNKAAKLFVDSISMVKAALAKANTHDKFAITAQFALLRFSKNQLLPEEVKKDREYTPSLLVIDKINKYKEYLATEYANDSLRLAGNYDWNKPGKWIAALQLIHFLKDHPAKTLFGAGIGNLSSRTAFKATTLGISGAYPNKFRYIHPWFHDNHLFIYVFFFAQQEQKHSAVNTPDSTYYQLLGEYGIAGVLAFLFFYLGYFLKRGKYMSYGLPVLLLLLAAFCVEYWFEQLSVVILAELLLFLDVRFPSKNDQHGEEQPV
ncbi:MAG: hypothetical protein ABIR18_12415 [Chitinophagaceae bacterium]